MPVQPVGNKITTSSHKIKLNPVTATGYVALAAGTLSVIAASNKKMKTHKISGYIAGALAFIHTGIVLGGRMAAKRTTIKQPENPPIKVQNG